MEKYKIVWVAVCILDYIIYSIYILIHNFTFHIPFPISSFHLFTIISFYFSFFSRLIQQANATQNSKRESFPPFSNSLTFSLFNFIDLRQTTYLCKNIRLLPITYRYYLKYNFKRYQWIIINNNSCWSPQITVQCWIAAHFRATTPERFYYRVVPVRVIEKKNI